MRFVPEFITTNFIDKKKKKSSMEDFQNILVTNEQKNQALADSIKSAKIALEIPDNVSEIKKGGYEIFKNIAEETNTKLNSIFNFAHSLQSDTDIQTEEKQEWEIVCEKIKQLPSLEQISIDNDNDLKNIQKKYGDVIKITKNILNDHYKPTNEKHRTLMKVVNLCAPLLKKGERIEEAMQFTGDDFKKMKTFLKKGFHKTKTIERSIGILINIEKIEKGAFKKEFEKRYSIAPKDDKIRAFMLAAQFETAFYHKKANEAVDLFNKTINPEQRKKIKLDMDQFIFLMNKKDALLSKVHPKLIELMNKGIINKKLEPIKKDRMTPEYNEIIDRAHKEIASFKKYGKQNIANKAHKIKQMKEYFAEKNINLAKNQTDLFTQCVEFYYQKSKTLKKQESLEKELKNIIKEIEKTERDYEKNEGAKQAHEKKKYQRDKLNEKFYELSKKIKSLESLQQTIQSENNSYLDILNSHKNKSVLEIDKTPAAIKNVFAKLKQIDLDLFKQINQKLNPEAENNRTLENKRRPEKNKNQRDNNRNKKRGGRNRGKGGNRGRR